MNIESGETMGLINRQKEITYTSNLRGYQKIVDGWVDFGESILIMDLKSKKWKDEETIPILMHRKVLTTLDGLSHMILLGSQDPLMIMGRSALETVLSLEYLVSDDTIEKSRAIFVYDRLKKIKDYKNSLQDFSGKGMKDHSKSEFLEWQLKFQLFEQNSFEFLSEHRFIKYFNAMERGKNLRNAWYYYYDSSVNGFKSLCKHVGKLEIYSVLYMPWSNFTHGTNFLNEAIANINENEAGVNEIRIPFNIQSIVSSFFPIILDLYKVYIDHRTPSLKNDFRVWKLNQLEILRKLMATEFIKKSD